NSSGFIIVGRRGATATYSLSGGTLAAVGDFMWVGDGDSAGVPNSIGSFTQTGGAVSVHNGLELGHRSGSGTYIMNGGTINCGSWVIGGSGDATNVATLHGRGTFTINAGVTPGEVTVTGNGNVGFTT